MLDKYDLMKLLSTSGKYRGFNYLLDGINLAAQNDDLLHPLKLKLYPILAEKYGTNIGCVERNIRTLIAIWWNNGKDDTLKPHFDKESGVPGNKEFIYHLVAQLQRNKIGN